MDGPHGICSGLSPSKVISGVCSPQGLSLGLSGAPRLPEARLTHGTGRTEPRHSFQLSVGVGEASSFTQDEKTLLLVFK